MLREYFASLGTIATSPQTSFSCHILSVILNPSGLPHLLSTLQVVGESEWTVSALPGKVQRLPTALGVSTIWLTCFSSTPSQDALCSEPSPPGPSQIVRILCHLWVRLPLSGALFTSSISFCFIKLPFVRKTSSDPKGLSCSTAAPLYYLCYCSLPLWYWFLSLHNGRMVSSVGLGNIYCLLF